MKTATTVCGKCGAEIPADARPGACPACLLETGLGLLVEELQTPNPPPPLTGSAVASAQRPTPNVEFRGEGRVPKSGRMITDFGDYELLEEIGRGGQGVVYRARQKSLNRTVALKVIGLGHWATEAHVKRFRREAEAAANLDHSYIVPIHEVGERDGCCYFSMNFVEGGQLDEVVQHTPMSIRKAAELIAKVARTVHYAHEHGILHRDIKPGNILLDQEGEPHLSDFGLARLVETESTVTGTREVLGTPSYMAPEQAVGEARKLTSATDVYGLGAVLYQLLTGQPPFTGGTTYETVKLLLEREPRQPRLLNPKVDRDLSAICLKCLEKDPQRRYPAAAGLAEDLEHWLKHEPIRAKPTGFFTHSRKWIRRNPSTAVLVTLLLALALGLSVMVWERTAQVVIPKSIAVLPFQNLSPDPGNAYLAEGIQNEIVTRLASVRDLKVISRTSTAKYQSKPDNLKTVAQELGVSIILEGAVQKAGDKVRVNVQLIDARVDTHLWAKSYDRDFKDVLGVESEVSQEIAEVFQANLSPSESHALASVRTLDTEAYNLFLRGEYELDRSDTTLNAGPALDRADAFCQQALERDPNFAEAAAALARSRLTRHQFVSSLEPAELEEVKSLIDRALALAPNSPEAHAALGLFFYWGHRQYEAALREFKRTVELQPNSALARTYCAWVYRRRGEWERSLTEFQRAQELNPRDVQIWQNIGATYLRLRQWKDAERAELRALAIDPYHAWAALALLISHLNATGDVDSARRALDGFPEATKSLTLVGDASGIGDVASMIGMWVYLDVMERRFRDAVRSFEKEGVNDDLGRLQQLAGRAALRLLAGEPDVAKSAGDEALSSLEARLRERPDDTFAMKELSWVYLAVGRNADALRLSRQAADTVSIEKDAFSGPNFQNALAQIEARAGAPEEAIKRLRHLLSIPAGQVASIARFKIDPVWDPIRNRPDFQQLLAGPEQIGPNK
jgi:serine/threonine protein kinase/tetratricopeptide (TPR) repeat protein